MKNLYLPGICLSLLLICASAPAQEKIPVNEPDLNKPKLFSNLPDKIPVNILDLQGLVNTETGKEVSLMLEKNTSTGFTGKVVSAASKYNNNIRSVVIRSSNFNGATLTLSSSILANGTVKITGRIISPQHGDLYELQKLNDEYMFIKKNYYDLINE
ncbi:MAG TPA: hypothetical protein VIZ28_00885 [Chitinophagaceae bacterium]